MIVPTALPARAYYLLAMLDSTKTNMLGDINTNNKVLTSRTQFMTT